MHTLATTRRQVHKPPAAGGPERALERTRPDERPPAGHCLGDPRCKPRPAGVGRPGRAVRPANLVDLPPVPAGRRRCRRRRPDSLAPAPRPPGRTPRAGRGGRLAGHHDPPGMRPGPARSAGTAGCRACAGRREHPGRADPDGGAGTAGGRAGRRAARGVRPSSLLLPAADRPAHGRPAPVVCPDQRPTGHPSREHRATPRPLPAQTAARSGDRRPTQPRRRVHGNRAAQPRRRRSRRR